MHRLSTRTYVGQPNEDVILSTQPDNGGQVTAVLDGQPIPPNGPFSLAGNPGAQNQLQVLLTGPIGASTVVDISVVDGESDNDFLLCQPHNPAPVHFYSFLVAAQTAVARFGTMRGERVARMPRSRKRKQPRRKRGAK